MQTKPTHRAGFLLYKKKKKKKDKWKICYAFPTWPKFPEVKGFRLLWTLHFSYSFAAHCFHMMPMRVWHHNMIISGTSCSSSREEEHKYLVWNWHNGNPLGVPFLVMWNFFLFCCLQQTLKHTLHTFSSTQTHLYSSTLGNQLHKDKRNIFPLNTFSRPKISPLSAFASTGRQNLLPLPWKPARANTSRIGLIFCSVSSE